MISIPPKKSCRVNAAELLAKLAKFSNKFNLVVSGNTVAKPPPISNLKIPVSLASLSILGVDVSAPDNPWIRDISMP